MILPQNVLQNVLKNVPFHVIKTKDGFKRASLLRGKTLRHFFAVDIRNTKVKSKRYFGFMVFMEEA